MKIKIDYDGIRIGSIEENCYEFFHFQTGVLYSREIVYLGDKKITIEFIKHYTLDKLMTVYPLIKKYLDEIITEYPQVKQLL